MSEPAFDPLMALGTLLDHNVRFVLIGGFAGALRGSPVITGDVDICYAREDANLERLAEALRAIGAHLRGAPPDVPFQLDARTLRAGDHFTFTTSAGALDILGTPSGTSGFADLNSDATDEEIDGLTVRVASVEDLIRMKRAAGRPKDLIELEWLSAVRDEVERGDEQQ
jgi:HEAT repeat protein